MNKGQFKVAYARYVGDGTGKLSNAQSMSKIKPAIESLGWTLDTEYHPDGWRDGTDAHAYFKGTGGEKLFVSYSGSGTSASQDGQARTYYKGSSYNTLCGLIVTMLPAPTDTDARDLAWGADKSPMYVLARPDTPTEMLPVVADSDSSSISFHNNTLDVAYQMTIVSDGRRIIFDGTSSRMKSFWMGEIFDTLAHPTEDTSRVAKYGIFSLGDSGNYTSFNKLSTGERVLNSWIQDKNYWSSNSNPSAKLAHVFANAAGEWIHGSYSAASAYRLPLYAENALSASACTPITRGKARWLAIGMTSVSENINTSGYVVPGDGMKGWLDTDMIRAVCPTGLQTNYTLDNGNFIYVGNGLMMGWSAANDTKYW